MGTYDSDRYGFNNPDQVWDLSKENKNLVILGDSFAHGSCSYEKTQLLKN